MQCCRTSGGGTLDRNWAVDHMYTGEVEDCKRRKEVMSEHQGKTVYTVVVWAWVWCL